MDEKHKKRPMRQVEKIVTGIVIVATVLYAGGFLLVDSWFNGNACPTAQQVEDIASFQLPPSAEKVVSICRGFKGYAVFVRFEMLSEDLSRFTNRLWLKTTLTTTGEPSFVRGWADVVPADIPFDKMTSYLYSIENDQRYVQQEILIDTSDPERYTVYLLVLAG